MKEIGFFLAMYIVFIFIFFYYVLCSYFWASLVAQLVKNLPAMWETWV